MKLDDKKCGGHYDDGDNEEENDNFSEYHLLAFKNIAKFSLITRHTSGNTRRGFVQKIKSKLEKWRYAFKIYQIHQPRIFFFTYESSDIFIALHIFLTSVIKKKSTYQPVVIACIRTLASTSMPF